MPPLDQLMTFEALVNLIAILASPVIAVCVTLWHQTRSEKRRAKFHVFTTLVANRHRPISDENISSLHLIDTIFVDAKRVRELWHRYYDLLHSSDSSDTHFQRRQQLYRDMLVEMSRTLGYASAIESGDIERIYTPRGMGEDARRSDETAEEWLRVLKASESLGSPRIAGGAQRPSSVVEINTQSPHSKVGAG